MPLDRVWLLGVLKHMRREMGDDDVGGVAAALAYHFLLALFPFFVFLTSLGGLIAEMVGGENPAPRIVQQLGASLPPAISGVLIRELGGVIDTSHPGLVSFGLAAAVWATMGGMKSLMRAINRAYDVPESRPFLRQNVVALGLSALSGVFVLGAFALFLSGDLFAHQIASVLGLPALTVTLARFVIAATLLLVVSAFVYWAAPNLALEFRWITAGSVLFTAGWLAATALFAAYVDHFGSYNATYGTLGGIVAALVWFFLTAYILLLGAELNAVIDSQLDAKSISSQERYATEPPHPSRTQDSRPRTAHDSRLAGHLLGVFALCVAVLLVGRSQRIRERSRELQTPKTVA
jgi:membrane protein